MLKNLKILLFGLEFFIVIFTFTVFPQNAFAAFQDADSLIKECNGDKISRIYCMGYVASAVDNFMSKEKSCTSKVTIDEVINAFVEQLSVTKSMGPFNASQILDIIIETRFSCKQ